MDGVESNISYKPTALKQLQKLSGLEQRKVIKKIEYLAGNPELGKQLKGVFAGLRSIRAWPYRVVYQLEDSKITIVSIAHRKDVYRLRDATASPPSITPSNQP